MQDKDTFLKVMCVVFQHQVIIMTKISLPFKKGEAKIQQVLSSSLKTYHLMFRVMF